jgi:hypothetical protein
VALSALLPAPGIWVLAKIALVGAAYVGVLVLSGEVTAADLGMGKSK